MVVRIQSDFKNNVFWLCLASSLTWFIAVQLVTLVWVLSGRDWGIQRTKQLYVLASIGIICSIASVILSAVAFGNFKSSIGTLSDKYPNLLSQRVKTNGSQKTLILGALKGSLGAAVTFTVFYFPLMCYTLFALHLKRRLSLNNRQAHELTPQSLLPDRALPHDAARSQDILEGQTHYGVAPQYPTTDAAPLRIPRA